MYLCSRFWYESQSWWKIRAWRFFQVGMSGNISSIFHFFFVVSFSISSFFLFLFLFPLYTVRKNRDRENACTYSKCQMRNRTWKLDTSMRGAWRAATSLSNLGHYKKSTAVMTSPKKFVCISAFWILYIGRAW